MDCGNPPSPPNIGPYTDISVTSVTLLNAVYDSVLLFTDLLNISGYEGNLHSTRCIAIRTEQTSFANRLLLPIFSFGFSLS